MYNVTGIFRFRKSVAAVAGGRITWVANFTCFTVRQTSGHGRLTRSDPPA